MVHDMSSSNITMRSSRGKAPGRPAPPVPTPRGSHSSTGTGGNNSSTSKPTMVNEDQRAQKMAGPSKSDTAIKMVKMNDEILQYRLNLREKQNQPLKKNLASETDTSSNVDTCNANITAGLETVESLQRNLQDVTVKNAQWQVYNEQREEYVKNLIEKYNNLHQQFYHLHESYTSLTNNPDKLSEEQRRYFDSLLIQARQELGASCDESSKLKSKLSDLKIKFADDSKKLNKEIDLWRVRYEQEKEVNGVLRKELRDSGRRKRSSNNADKENADHIVSLQKEMELYRHDFSSERRKREDLEKRLDSLQRGMKDSKISPRKKVAYSSHHHEDNTWNQNSSHRRHKPSASPPKIKKISDRQAFSKELKPQRASYKERRSHPVQPGYDSSRAREHTGSDDSCAERLKSNDRMNRTYSEFGHHITDELLRCPNCGKVYGVDEHEFLLIHIDSCF